LARAFVWDIAHTSSVSPDLEVPKWIVYLCIPLGSYLMCFRFPASRVVVRAHGLSCRTMMLRTSKASRKPPTRRAPTCIRRRSNERRHPRPGAGPTLACVDTASADRIPVALKLAGVPIANAWIIFALLFGLMLTGCPISISLGLTVLTYLFTMTTCRSSRLR
jgi:hypothetical protein